MFSSYSPQLALQLGYTATNVSLVALSGNFAVALTGPFSGAMVDKRGYKMPLFIGAAGLTFGYVGLRAQFIALRGNLFYLCLCLFGVGCGLTFLFLVCLKCCAVTFPMNRGVATSFPSAMYGLLAMFYSVAASSLFPGDTLGFLLFLPLSVVIIFIVCAPVVMKCEPRRAETPRVISVLEPMDLKSREGFGSLVRDGSATQDASDESRQSLLHSPRFWLLFVITGAMASVGQMYIYSVGYMVKSLITGQFSLDDNFSKQNDINAFVQGEQHLQVGLISTANCTGRLLAGFMGDFVRQKLRLPRSWLLLVPGFGFTIAQFMARSIRDYHSLHLLSVISGFMYGFTFCILPIIVGDVFGMANFSRNWGIMGLAPLFPSNLFTSYFGVVYDSNSVTSDQGLHLCLLGKGCYDKVFNFSLVIALVALIVVFLFNFGDKVLSSRTISGKRRPVSLV